jgi:murein DD-endopeptidase MepM/ murein hydrolase activator NlpD
LRVRDGTPDISVRVLGRAQVEGSECGNGAVIAHADGLETQYCHMESGSLRVRPGDDVAAGQVIGRIGLSGLTEYPHLHFTVRRSGTIIDPFAPDSAPGACGSTDSLWEESLGAVLAYKSGAILNRGFAEGPVTMEAIESGEAGRATPGPDAPAVVAFVRAIGLRQGDVQRLALMAPDGRTLAEGNPKPLERARAQEMLFVGLRRPPAGWTRGRYTARYEVIRGGETALAETFALDLR